MSARRIRVHGIVQGVGFRDALRREARRLGLRGWVRNRSEGTVEALAVGDDAALGALERWARRGPPAARVDRVEATPLDDAGLAAADPAVGSDFRQVDTAWD
jgi:acylphosphatase